MSSAAPPSRSRLVDYTTTSRAAQPPSGAAFASQIGASASRTSRLQNGQRFTAAVVVVFIFGTTALSLYDLYLFLTLVR